VGSCLGAKVLKRRPPAIRTALAPGPGPDPPPPELTGPFFFGFVSFSDPDFDIYCFQKGLFLVSIEVRSLLIHGTRCWTHGYLHRLIWTFLVKPRWSLGLPHRPTVGVFGSYCPCGLPTTRASPIGPPPSPRVFLISIFLGTLYDILDSWHCILVPRACFFLTSSLS